MTLRRVPSISRWLHRSTCAYLSHVVALNPERMTLVAAHGHGALYSGYVGQTYCEGSADWPRAQRAIRRAYLAWCSRQEG